MQFVLEGVAGEAILSKIDHTTPGYLAFRVKHTHARHHTTKNDHEFHLLLLLLCPLNCLDMFVFDGSTLQPPYRQVLLTQWANDRVLRQQHAERPVQWIGSRLDFSQQLW